MRYIRILFAPIIPHIQTQEEYVVLEENLVRRLLARFSRGNVSLRLGSYLTSKDVEQRRHKLRNYEF
jgi:hypothetical protein